jgi:fatty acid desaturase
VRNETTSGVEWPTVLLIIACYGAWALATTWLYTLWAPAGFVLLVMACALQSSLTHEVLHGHPTRNPAVNEALVFLAIGLAYPYRRFRDLHLDHHRDEFLTDPYDDPESNYLDPKVWHRLPRPVRAVLRFNNTLLGRLTIGPGLASALFYRSELKLLRAGDRSVRLAWALHLLGVIPVVVWVWQAPIGGWAYVVAAYAGLAVIRIRTFLEHRAHDLARGRSVIVEGNGFWAGILPFFFLNNNLHYVHHAKPGVAWYRLPAIYRQRREEFLRRNEGYVFRSYGEVFRAYFFRPKDPVPHPLWPDA